MNQVQNSYPTHGRDKAKTISLGFTALFISLSGVLWAQQTSSAQSHGNAYVPLNGATYHLIDRIDIQYANSYQYLHTAIKPYLREQIPGLAIAWQNAETLSRRDSFNVQYLCNDNKEFCLPGKGNYYAGDLFDFFYPEPATFYQFFSLRINPVLHNAFGMSSDSSNLRFTNTRGLELRGSIDNKVGFYFYATDNQAILPQFVQERVDAAPQVVPGEGLSKIFKENGVDYLSARGFISFNATKNISMLFGHDKVFIGDGIRSLIWSDNADDQLMFRINTKIWRLQYMNMFTELANYDGSNIYNSLIHKKYAALHYLNAPITKNFQIGVFESIIFDRYNAMGNETGFELQYLNPIIFYRAVESGLGSSDNVVLGTNWKWNFLKRFSFYGQVVLDEFVFSELFSGDGWWGNKYAVQSGLKYIDAFGLDQLDLQYEVNMVRPYTYSYEDDNGSSYTHYAQAIAHPLGANFYEHLFSLWYQPKERFVLRNTTMLATKGTDTAGVNYGGNIFLDYNTFASEYGNTLAQGVEEKIFLNDLLLSWYFWHNTSIDLRCIYRRADNAIDSRDANEFFYSIGIRMNEVPKWNLF